MSHFLANLVQRAAGTAAVVQPRLAARFEPDAEPQTTGWSAPFVGPTDAERWADPVDREAVLAPLAARGPGPSGVPATPAAGRARASAASGIKASPSSPSPPSSEDLARPDRSTPPQRPGEYSDHMPDSGLTAGPAVQPEPSRRTLEPPAMRPVGTSVVPPDRSSSHTGRRQERADGLPIRPGLAAATAPVAADVSAGMRPPAGANGLAPAGPLAQPTVSVTIGRIVVHAVQPARTTSRTQPEPSGRGASLDDYLKRRDGGRP